MNKLTAMGILDYDCETGELRWKMRTEKHIQRPSSLKSWNTRYAGKLIKTIDGKGYLHFSFGGKFYRAHRIAWLIHTGEIPNIIDHINGDRQDNRISNLQNTTMQGNHLNQRMNSKNTSGVTGVYMNKRSGSWCAQMKFNGHTYHLGSSKSLFDVACMRKSEEVRLGFNINHGRVKNAN